MAQSGVSRSDSGNPPEMELETTTSPQQSAAEAPLDLVEGLLRSRGWCQGRPVDQSGRLSIDAAIDAAALQIATDDTSRLVLASRMRNQLSRAGGIGNLAAWNDHADRRFGDITELLAVARFHEMSPFRHPTPTRP